MNRRSYFGFLFIMLTLVLAACGGGGGAQPANSKVTINWWHIQTGDPGKSDWQNLANQYMKAHPNVSIKITILENDAFKTKLATVMQSGTPPDLFQSWGGGVMAQYANAGLLKDISSQLQGDWGNSFSQPALKVYSANGKYYGVPWDMGAVGFWYNPALFAKAGIQQPPATWTDFLTDVKKLEAAGITPLSLGEKDKWPGHFYWVYLAVRLGGKDAFDKAYGRTGSFADAPFVQAGTELQKLIALNPFQKGYLGAAYGDEQTAMGNQKAAMELQGQWAPAADAGQSPTKKLDLAFFPFPAVDGGAGNPSDVMGGGNGFAVGKNAPPETVDFLKFITTADVQRNMAKQGAVLPTVLSAQNAVTDPQLQKVLQLVANANYYQLYYDQYLPPALGDEVKDATQGLYAGTMTPDAVAKAIEATAATELK